MESKWAHLLVPQLGTPWARWWDLEMAFETHLASELAGNWEKQSVSLTVAYS